jgi:1-acyl-sn-glycerol-3-phosphate acyltransferase
MTFFDNKQRLSFTFFSGSPGKMRVRVFPAITTKQLTIEETSALSTKVYDLIKNSLIADSNA